MKKKCSMPEKKPKKSSNKGNAKNYYGMDYYPTAKVKKHEKKEKKLIKKLSNMHKDY